MTVSFFDLATSLHVITHTHPERTFPMTVSFFDLATSLHVFLAAMFVPLAVGLLAYLAVSIYKYNRDKKFWKEMEELSTEPEKAIGPPIDEIFEAQLKKEVMQQRQPKYRAVDSPLKLPINTASMRGSMLEHSEVASSTLLGDLILRKLVDREDDDDDDDDGALGPAVTADPIYPPKVVEWLNRDDSGTLQYLPRGVDGNGAKQEDKSPLANALLENNPETPPVIEVAVPMSESDRLKKSDEEWELEKKKSKFFGEFFGKVLEGPTKPTLAPEARQLFAKYQKMPSKRLKRYAAAVQKASKLRLKEIRAEEKSKTHYAIPKVARTDAFTKLPVSYLALHTEACLAAAANTNQIEVFDEPKQPIKTIKSKSKRTKK